MSNEDFRQKLLQRPQEILSQRERDASQKTQPPARPSNSQQVAKSLEGQLTEARRQIISDVIDAYEASGLHEKMIVLASTIGDGQILQTVSEHAPTTLTFSILYKQQRGHTLVKIPNPSPGDGYPNDGWHNVFLQQTGYCYAVDPSPETTLQDMLVIEMGNYRSSPYQLYMHPHNLYWTPLTEQTKRQWEFDTNTFLHKKPEHTELQIFEQERIYASDKFIFPYPPSTSKFSTDENDLQSGAEKVVVSLYDHYLVFTGQV